MVKLFFLVSGEHPTLPYSEVRAILEAKGFFYRSMKTLKQVLSFDADKNCLHWVSTRSSLTKACALELFRCKADRETIIRYAKAQSYNTLIKKKQTFAVRVIRVQKSSPHLDTVDLQVVIGEIILQNMGSKVKLVTPDRLFFGVLTQEMFILGLNMAEINSKPFVYPRRKKLPFSHPSMMASKLARCMVNLARPRADSIVLDPFCGTGSLLIEAGLINCKVLGSDIDPRMVKGCIQNLEDFGINPIGLLVADARRTPFKQADCVVTDPPYGISATTLGSTTKAIVSEFLSTIIDILPKQGHITISSPRKVGTTVLGKDVGFKRVERHLVYEHRRLTREIAVLEKP